MHDSRSQYRIMTFWTKAYTIIPRSWLVICSAILLWVSLRPVSIIAAENVSLQDTFHVPISTPGPDGHSSNLLQGKLLVANRYMQDPRFIRTVILIIRHDRNGTAGVIINKPTVFPLSQAFPDLEGFSGRTDPVFWGGPVDQYQAIILIRSDTEPADSFRVFDDIHVSSSKSILKHMSDSMDVKKYRLFLGYAGWAPRQLGREIIRGDWLVLRADAQTVFSEDPSGIWDRLILFNSGQQVMAR